MSDKSKLHEQFGFLLEKSGKFEKAIVHYRKALQCSSGDADFDARLHFRLGNLLARESPISLEARTRAR